MSYNLSKPHLHSILDLQDYPCIFALSIHIYIDGHYIVIFLFEAMEFMSMHTIHLSYSLAKHRVSWLNPGSPILGILVDYLFTEGM